MSGVLVIAETRRGVLRDISFELITAAVALGAGPVRVAIVAADAGAHAAQLGADGVEEVIIVDSPVAEFEPQVTAAAVEALICELSPAVVLAGHTIDSLGFAAAVAATSDTGFAADVTALRFNGALEVDRGIHGDRFIQTLDFPGYETVVVLVRPGTFAEASPGDLAPVRAAPPVDAAVARSEHLGYQEPEAGDVDITRADFLLAIGRGTEIDDESGARRYYELAERIGATLVSSRPLVDAGVMPAARQVGQSGRTVAPRVYLALGISGAVQHLAGVRNADTIIAVNTDPNAPIFGVADCGAHVDLNDLVDALADEF